MTEANVKKASGWRANKWIRAAIPALLLHCSIGTVYCWSIFSQEIADYIGFTKGATDIISYLFPGYVRSIPRKCCREGYS